MRGVAIQHLDAASYRISGEQETKLGVPSKRHLEKHALASRLFNKYSVERKVKLVSHYEPSCRRALHKK